MGQVTDAIGQLVDPKGVGRQLTGFDGAAWRTSAKDRTMRTAIVGAVLLDRAPDWERFRARYERLTRMVPLLRERPLFGAADVLNPRMANDPDFDLDLHLRRIKLPDGAGWDAVLAEARRMALIDFDHDRPLWETVLIEGLPEGHAAIVFKMHHAIADGKATVQMGANLLELTREGNPDEPDAPPAPAADRSTMAAVTTANLTDLARSMLDTAKGSAKMAGDLALGSVRSPRQTWSNAFGVLDSIRRATAIPNSMMSPLMTGRGASYTFRTFELPFKHMKAASKSHGSTVNDVFLASCQTGLANYHDRHGQPTEELRFIVPISIRDTSKDGSASNEVALARFPLPVSGASVAERIRAAHDEVKAWRDEPAIALTNEILQISWLVPMPVLRHSTYGTDVTASNVPGPPIPLYVSGAEILGTWPLVATSGCGVNITMVTYAGRAEVGVSVDDQAVPDVEAFMAELKAGFTEVIGQDAEPTEPLATSS